MWQVNWIQRQKLDYMANEIDLPGKLNKLAKSGLCGEQEII